MARNTDPILKTCRSLDISPAYLGINKTSKRAPHASPRKKMSEYAVQLREKQRVKFIYGVLEKQFRIAFRKACKLKGVKGENLLILMELRLDNVVFRLNLAQTRRQARQIVTHGHIAVNGKPVNIASYQVKPNDIISVQEKSRTSELFAQVRDHGRTSPAWLSADLENMSGKVERMPLREEIDLPVNESLIVEYYSR